MQGDLFFNKIKKNLKPGQRLCVEFTFNKWLKKSHYESLQFNINSKNRKSIPEYIIVHAKNASDKGVIIDNNWLKKSGCNRGWCVAILLNWLIKNY